MLHLIFCVRGGGVSSSYRQGEFGQQQVLVLLPPRKANLFRQYQKKRKVSYDTPYLCGEWKIVLCDSLLSALKTLQQPGGLIMFAGTV